VPDEARAEHTDVSRSGRKSAKIQHLCGGKGALYRCPFVLARR
jgi:hypothetical protein